MDMIENYVMITMLDPATPGFVTCPVVYLGSKEAGEQIPNEGVRVPKSIKLRGTREYVQWHWTHDHINTWGCCYHLKASLLRAKCYYLRVDKEYLRAIQFHFQDLNCSTEDENDWHPITVDGCWGNKGVMATDEQGGICNTLLMIDRRFKTFSDFRADLADPQEIDYQPFFDEVFADG